MGKIFTTVGLKWIPTRKLFDSCTSKVDSEPPNGSKDDITNQYECDQALNVSACTLNLSTGLAVQRQMASADNTSGPAPQRKERCTLQCALSLKEEKSSYLQEVLSTTSISSHARSVNKWINYFKPLPNVDHPVPEVPTPVLTASTSSPSSTIADQDAPSTSTSQNTLEQQSSVISQGVEDEFYDIEVAHMDNITTRNFHHFSEVPTLVLAASTSSPSSTTADQNAPSTSTSQNTSEQQSSVIPQGVEDDFYDIEVAHMDKITTRNFHHCNYPSIKLDAL
ncbi:hypothetical protein Tco_0129507 [Tanacetum coccineum]